MWIDGRDGTQRKDSNFSSVSPQYFKTLRIPMLAGRDFNDSETAQSPRAAIVNKAFARLLGLGENPIGMRFRREATPTTPEEVNEIVGVVQDTKYHQIRRPAEAIAYLDIAQDKEADNSMQVLVRSTLPMETVEAAIRRTVHEVSSGISFDFEGLQDQIRQSLQAERLLATLSGFFGALAVVLAMIGLVRGDVVHSGGADERDRHPHGAGCAALGCDGDDSAKGGDAVGGRSGSGRGVIPRCRKRGERAAVRVEAA